MFILFKAPPEKDLEWDDADVEGQFRFLNRVWRLVTEYITTVGAHRRAPQTQPSKDEKTLRRAVHTAIQAITEDIDGDYQFNTAVSELMKLSNALTDSVAKDVAKDSAVYTEGVRALVLLLAPFAPHLADELWHQLGNSGSVHRAPWPVFDPGALVVDEITLVIQIMGKTRGTLEVPANSDKAALEKFARESEVTQRYIEGKEIKKVIVVPGKLVNFVLAG
jgi:leucyl-tRNA synthetase